MMPGMQGLGERVRLRWALTFQYARQIDTPSGRQVVIATDHHFKFGEPPAERVSYAPTDAPAETGTLADPPRTPEFTLLDIRFGPDGKGIGKIASAEKVAYNAAKKTFEIDNFTAQPTRLSAVKLTRP
jgi:hypothetical protein